MSGHDSNMCQYTRVILSVTLAFSNDDMTSSSRTTRNVMSHFHVAMAGAIIMLTATVEFCVS